MFRRVSASLAILFNLCLVLLAFFSTGWAAEKKTVADEVLVIGSGTVTEGNIAAAKEEAIAHAMSKAVENYLASRLGEADMINSFERLVREILPTAKDEIENFQILAENLDVDQYRVLVKVKINRDVIEEKLRLSGIATVEAPNIRILFMVSEVKGNRLSYWWKGPETFSQMTQTDVILYRVFQERGFIPVNRTLGSSGITYSEGMTSPKLDVSDLLQWGKMLSADVVISGQSVIMDDSRVFMALKAFSVKEGLELGEAAETGLRDLEKDSTVTTGLLLERVARTLVGRLRPSIVQVMSEKPADIHVFQVQLKGLRNFREYRKFREFLTKEVPGVQSVKQSRIEGGIVTIRVAFLGEREKFLGRILNREGLPLRIGLEKSQDNEIVLSVME
ncbi:MAG: hypothetical protein WAL98_03415 [Desulfatiglandaceae bacterium]